MKYFKTRGTKTESKMQINEKAEVKFKRKKKTTENKQKTLPARATKSQNEKCLNDPSKNIIARKPCVLKKKCQNKVKTLQISFDTIKAVAQQQIVDELVNAKCCLAPQDNLKLYNMVSRAIKENVPWPIIESTLQYNEKPKINKNCFLLELKYKKKVSLLLSLRSPNIGNLKKVLKPIWKKFKCSDEPVMQHFNYRCRLEALAPYSTATHFADFERNLSTDAVSCQAKGVGIMDYETGAVYFQCSPTQLPSLVEGLEKRNYKVLYTNYDLQAKREVCLDPKEMLHYKKLLSELQKFKEVENYYDNLVKSE